MFKIIFILYILSKNTFAQNFQNYDPSKLTEIAPPVVGSHLPFTQFSNTNLPTVPIVQNATNLNNANNMPNNNISIAQLTPDQINELNNSNENTENKAPNQKDKITETHPISEAKTNIPESNTTAPVSNNIPQNEPFVSTIPNNHHVSSNKNTLTIIGSDGAIPEAIKQAEQKAIEPIIPEQTQTNQQPAVIRNTSKIKKQAEALVYTMTDKQKAAKNENLPDPALKLNEHIGHQRQILPPNISQKVYTSANSHLSPVIFQGEIDSIAFKYTANPNDTNILRSLLDKISSIDIQDQDGNTLLIYSVYNLNYDSVIMLLQRAANPNIYNDSGFGPLHLAATLGDSKSVRVLLQYGADINKPDSTGTSPIMYAVSSGDIETVKYLFKHNANIEIINRKNMNIIDFAKNNVNKNMIPFLQNIIGIDIPNQS